MLRYTKEWEATVKRIGRWIDFENGYRTMDLSFMESVWWVFKQIYDKGLVYRGSKVMPYSTALTTPLSNFEANLNYKETRDPAVFVTFPITGRVNVTVDPEGKQETKIEHSPAEIDGEFLAWTTTPWTLPSNLALCVNPTMDYVRLRDIKTDAIYIMAKLRVGELYDVPKVTTQQPKSGMTDEERARFVKEEAARVRRDMLAKLPPKTNQYEILSEHKGSDLVGLTYTPIFPYFQSSCPTAFRVIADAYVTDDSGTGIVHNAPAFGEDDYRVCLLNGITRKDTPPPCPLDDSGRFTSEVTDFAGTYVKDADKNIIAKLKAEKRVVKIENIVHKYPFCWRSETPLLMRTIPSWFIRVESFRERILNRVQEQTYWVPDSVKSGRFASWLSDARDWAVSRSRYWGTPLPIWMSQDAAQIVVVGSVAELEKLSGVSGITDIHKDKIDDITIPDPRGPDYPALRRVPDVFDCWFESGSMPYAQQHYPFERKDEFKNLFPAQFIAEGLDQTRGWFYTLMVLGTALFDSAPFQNVIVNGMMLAADGKKMSKRLKNYPDPMDVVESYGADALRLYLINSPVVRAESVNFKEEGVKLVVKTVLLPWWNAFRFFIENAIRYSESFNETFIVNTGVSSVGCGGAKLNVLDQWIISSTQTLLKGVRSEMAAYRLYTVVPLLLRFIDQLTNTYVRSNRRRIKSAEKEDRHAALSVLGYVLLTVAKLMAPMTPFITETMYQHMKPALPEAERMGSVHFLPIPTENDALINKKIEVAVQYMQTVMELARGCRIKRDVSLKVPLRTLTVASDDDAILADLAVLKEYISDELNVRDIIFDGNLAAHVTPVVAPKLKVVGKQLGKRVPDVVKAVSELNMEQLAAAKAQGSVTITLADGASFTLKYSDLDISVRLAKSSQSIEMMAEGAFVVILDVTPDRELAIEGAAREFVSRIQRLRKATGLSPQDKVELWVQYGAKELTPGEVDATISETINLATMDLPIVARSHNASIQRARKAVGLPQDIPAKLVGDDAYLPTVGAGTEAAAAYYTRKADADGNANGNGNEEKNENKESGESGDQDDREGGNEAIKVAIDEVLTGSGAAFISKVLSQPVHHRPVPAQAHLISKDVFSLCGEPVRIVLTRPALYIDVDRLVTGVTDKSSTALAQLKQGAVAYLTTLPLDTVLNSGTVQFAINGVPLTAKVGEHVFPSLDAALAANASV